MAKGNTVSIDALRPEIWQKELYANVLDNLYFTVNGMMGKGANNIVEIKDGLMKERGDTVTFGLTAKLDPNTGISSGGEVEGNENKIQAYSDSISIDQEDFAVRLTGILDEQKNAYDMRADAKDKLSMQMQEFIEMQVFLKLGGVNNTSLTDVSGNVVGTKAAWSNSPAQVPAADTAAGYGSRYLCADYTNGATSLAATDLLTPDLISRAKRKAQQRQANGMPKVMPIKINGRMHYVMFIHEWQGYDLKNNATYAQARREAESRGSENPIFTGAHSVWDNVIIHEHEYVPFLDISVAGNNFNASGSGTDFAAVDAFRALLCGAQAIGFPKCNMGAQAWVEKKFNYDRQTGFCTGLMGGIQKITFNSIDYGVVAVDTAATALV